MKKRTIALMLSVLAVLMLVGVGFATWVISQGADGDGAGTIIVETVRDERLTVSVTAVTSEFSFGAPANSTTGWLYSDNLIGGEAKPENLTVSFDVTVTKANGTFANIDELNLTGEMTSTFAGFDGHFLKLLSEAGAQGVVTNKAVNGANYTATVSFTVAWGDLFGNVNPYEYFKAPKTAKGTIDATALTNAEAAHLTGITAASTWADLALASLQALENMSENRVFTVTISALYAAH